AIVGDAEWRDLVYAFTGKGLREVPIEYFEANQEEAARQWLDIA
ncbi:MAG: STAS/SEC14 domain-containing protein, partial [Zetaproteobacteria bacterium]|nr:STAS/SEC14 domain-containing protein [Zetaproteobacteria bacterium]